MTRYNHVYDIAFSLESYHPNGDDVCACDIRQAVLKRLASMDDNELMEAIGYPFDT
jgi:hypothetical protein